MEGIDGHQILFLLFLMCSDPVMLECKVPTRNKSKHLVIIWPHYFITTGRIKYNNAYIHLDSPVTLLYQYQLPFSSWFCDSICVST